MINLSEYLFRSLNVPWPNLEGPKRLAAMGAVVAYRKQLRPKWLRRPSVKKLLEVTDILSNVLEGFVASGKVTTSLDNREIVGMPFDPYTIKYYLPNRKARYADTDQDMMVIRALERARQAALGHYNEYVEQSQMRDALANLHFLLGDSFVHMESNTWLSSMGILLPPDEKAAFVAIWFTDNFEAAVNLARGR